MLKVCALVGQELCWGMLNNEDCQVRVLSSGLKNRQYGRGNLLR
jgi:hypothetical protein